jgi:hypothetical protein
VSDRGEYRAIRRVLIDGPDFQNLPERARTLFLFLKLNFGPAGIEVWYPEEMIARLTRQTGIPSNAIRDSLDALEAAGWIGREGNIVWIVGQLDNDPHIRAIDVKHRAMVVAHIAGLPRLAIVQRFVAAHEAWFLEEELSEKGLLWALSGDLEDETGHRRALEGPKKGHRSTDNKNKTEDKDETDNQPKGAHAPGDEILTEAQAKKKALADDIERVSSHYTKTHPRRKITPELKKLIGRRLAVHSADDLCLAIDGNARDAWYAEKGKHDLSYVFRNSGQIEDFVERARIAAAGGGDKPPDITPTAKSYAAKLIRFYVDNGFARALPMEQHDARIDELAAEHKIKDPERVKRELRIVAPWITLQGMRAGESSRYEERVAKRLQDAKDSGNEPTTVTPTTVAAA